MEVNAEPATTGYDKSLRSGAAAPGTWFERQLYGCEVGTCSIDLLLPADSPRLNGEVEEHVRLLAESPAQMPPIIVHRPSMRVIDGMHRLAAARHRGDTEINVRWYDGDERDAFAMAVQTNVSHGLPLSLADRREAAARIIESHPDWSDRMIASIVSLGGSTVGAMRVSSSTDTAPSNARLGRDGRKRPVSTAEARELAGELLRGNPNAPLREVAMSTGLAPSTVLDVRNRIREGRDPVPSKLRRRKHVNGEPVKKKLEGVVSAVPQSEYVTALENLKRDPSIRYNNTGRVLLQWLQAGPTDAEIRSELVEQLPAHCLEEIATLARAHATAWQQFMLQLEDRNTDISRSL